MNYWEKLGFNKNTYCIWTNEKDEIALPLYEGRMVGQFDFAKKGWVSGKGRTAIWEEIPFDHKTINPNYLILEKICDALNKRKIGYKLSFIKVSAATNERTIISFLDRGTPHIEACPVLYTKDHSLLKSLLLTCIMNSFIFDYVSRFRVSGIAVNYNKIEENPLPPINKIDLKIINKLLENSAKLSFIHIKFAPDWLNIANYLPHLKKDVWKKNWAITFHERLRLRSEIDAIITYLYGISYNHFKWILRNDKSNPKGFWRVDNDKPEPIRLTTLTLKAFKELKQKGIDNFCKEDWLIPYEIQDKFKEELGPRFIKWQLKGSIEDSWKECEEHTKNILGEEKYKKFKELLNEGKDPFAIWAMDKNSNKSETEPEINKNKELQSKSKKTKNKNKNSKFKDIGDFI